MLVERTENDARTAGDTESPYRLLVADDQPHILEALRLLLKPEGYQLEMVRMPALVLEALAHESFDGVLIDLNYTRDTTSGQEGLDLVSRVKEIDAQLPVVVMTAWGNIDLAVEAMRRGAGDFIQKPWENARLLSILRTQMELHRSQKRTQWLEAENFAGCGCRRSGLYCVRSLNARGSRDDGSDWALGCECADHRGARDWQRGGGADAAPVVGPGGANSGSREYRRSSGGNLRERTLRTCERGFHGRACGSHRTVRACKRRDAVSG